MSAKHPHPARRLLVTCLLVAVAGIPIAGVAVGLWLRSDEPSPPATPPDTAVSQKTPLATNNHPPAVQEDWLDQKAPRPDQKAPRPVAPAERRDAGPKVVNLIDQFADVSEEGVGSHATDWAGGFVVTDEEFRFGGAFSAPKSP